MSSQCNECAQGCFDNEAKCMETCPRDGPDATPCDQFCFTQKNYCILDDCIAQGQCCDEICTPPPNFNPPQTPCQLCRDAMTADWVSCYHECEGDQNCVIECAYNASEAELACFFQNGQCCDETPGCGIPGGYNRAKRRQIVSQANSTFRNHAVASRVVNAPPNQYRKRVLNQNPGQSGRSAVQGRYMMNPATRDVQRNLMFERQIINPSPYTR